MDEAGDAVTGLYGAPKGRLRISPQSLFAHRHLMLLLSGFCRHDPDVKIDTLVKVNLSDAIYSPITPINPET